MGIRIRELDDPMPVERRPDGELDRFGFGADIHSRFGRPGLGRTRLSALVALRLEAAA
jgi:hypothetical protein